ncbi:GerAB/ArcD/ProY family transporter [Paenibacillus cremeus]|uniref:GerAB/ArcD/ProY family transporter n=1 Tax=Paenibacillus cremeus TaxID=2163881 RepID=A0A559K600_9BACL|nr:endospore germination permease [Paenibacillus cremeus]TVY07564.1 GerAB/ArcD/ProY family transporter [Paenibacillus cremeus]
MSSFSNPKINPFQGYFLCMCASLALSQIAGIVSLLEAAKRDSAISAIFGSIAYFLYAFWIYRIVSKQTPNHSFLEVLERKTGGVIAWAVKGWISLFLFCELFVNHKNIVTWVKSMILPFTPIWAISLPLLLVCSYLAVKGIKPIAISYSILLPAILVLVIFMAVFTLKYRHTDLLLPLFSEGARPILNGTVITLRGGMELFLLLLLTPHIEGRFQWKHLVMVVSVVSFFYINTTIGLLATFGPYEAGRQRFPLFTQWRLVKISSFVEHLDFLSMYQWLSNVAIVISLGLFLLGELLTSKQKHKKVLILAFTATLFICSELHLNDSVFLALVNSYFFPLSAISVLCWTVIATLVTRKGGAS